MTEPYYADESVTLFHGDCLEVTDWLGADVLVTDPPYGMSYVSGRRAVASPIVGDENVSARDAALAIWGTKPALVFGTWKQARPACRQLIVWDKRGGVGFSGDLRMPWADVTEEIYVIGEGWTGGRRPALYSVPVPASQSGERVDHPTPKPLRLMEHLITRCPDGMVADPFAGSGTTLIAAKLLDRRAIGVEIDERYCEIAAKRLSQGVLDFGGAA